MVLQGLLLISNWSLLAIGKLRDEDKLASYKKKKQALGTASQEVGLFFFLISQQTEVVRMWAKGADLPTRSTTWPPVASAVDSLQGLSRHTVSVKKTKQNKETNSELSAFVARLKAGCQFGVARPIWSEKSCAPGEGGKKIRGAVFLNAFWKINELHWNQTQ